VGTMFMNQNCTNSRKKLRRAVILACFIFGLLLAACGEKGIDHSEGALDPNEETEYRFPVSVELPFKPVDLVPLEKSGIDAGWVHTRTVPFGSINGDPVELNVFTAAENETCGSGYERVVLLNHEDETYRYQSSCFSASIEDEHLEQRQALFELDYRRGEPGGQSAVHGAAELAANGPGRMAYFYFDAAQERWFVFEEWGYPATADLDNDGAEELVIQFPGMHLSSPDVTVVRWQADAISTSGSIKDALGVPNVSQSTAQADPRVRRINVTAVTSLQPEAYETASYAYKRGQLLRQDP